MRWTTHMELCEEVPARKEDQHQHTVESNSQLKVGVLEEALLGDLWWKQQVNSQFVLVSDHSYLKEQPNIWLVLCTKEGLQSKPESLKPKLTFNQQSLLRGTTKETSHAKSTWKVEKMRSLVVHQEDELWNGRHQSKSSISSRCYPYLSKD